MVQEQCVCIHMLVDTRRKKKKEVHQKMEFKRINFCFPGQVLQLWIDTLRLIPGNDGLADIR